MALGERIRAELGRLEQDGLYRRRRIVDSACGPELVVGGRRFLAFCSNDYLGLANHPQVNAALRAGVVRWGTGSGAAHLITGHTAAHHALEEELAAFVDRPRALLFSSGYMANLGTVAALCGRGDTVLEDRLNHASLLDAGLLAGARLIRYAHASPEDLDARLAGRTMGARLVVTDGVFSMDGDVAPLPALMEVARRHDAWVMMDDAHGLGVIGPGGRGTLAHLGLPSAAVPVLVGTLGKAFGTAGAFVAGEADLIELLIQRARPYLYTTAPPPALAEATRAALRIARDEDWRRERLNGLIARFRCGAAQLGLPLIPSMTPIQPLVLGEPDRALAWMHRLDAQGIVVQAIRPPTVPPGTARLRITVSAAHTEAQVDRLLDGLVAAAQGEG